MVENGHMDHYFPQWLMRNWCDDRNEVWCFDKRSQKIKKKGTKYFGKEKDLNKSDVINLDLEATIFADLDDRHGAHTNALLLYSFFGKQKRVPNEIMRFFIELCLWTSIRNKRVQGWTDIEKFKSEIESKHIVHAWTDVELRKAIHLQFCKVCADDVMNREVQRLTKEFYYFFVVSENKFITSDMPVQEFGTEAAQSLLGCKRRDDDQCSLILFPVHPCVMFVATRHKEYADCQRRFIADANLIHANYDLQINSDAEELYFPYPIHDSRLTAASVADTIRQRVKGVPCAIDLDQQKENGIACIIHSNWSGEDALEHMARHT